MSKKNKFKNEGLDKYASTAADHAVFKALCDCGGDYEAMSTALGITVCSVRNRLLRLRTRAAKRGWSPNHDVSHPTPDGYHLKGTSTLYTRDKDTGEQVIAAQWVKTDKSREDLLENLRIAVDELAEPLKGLIKPVKAPKAKGHDRDLMAAYYIGDHHLGMYSWAHETGADYDCDIAEDILTRAFTRLGAAAPAAHKGLVVSIGDFFHADDHKGVTPRGGNQLDTDSRHSKVIQTGIRMMRRAIRFALDKHVEVEVLIIAGNHDPESAIWLAHCLAVAFDNEPHVAIRTDPRIYKYTKWGKCLIGTTHGHCAKPKDLPAIMAVDAPKWWGETKYREFIHGHFHQESVKPGLGCKIHCLSVLAPADAWHAGQGYRSERGMELAVYHKEQGRLMTLHGTVEYISS